MNKHTPGPWKVINKFGTSVGIEAGEFRQYVNGKSKDQIVMMVPCAEYNGGKEATLANASLIAAAPDLLHAAINAMNECCDLVATDAGDKLTAAIKKAIGGTMELDSDRPIKIDVLTESKLGFGIPKQIVRVTDVYTGIYAECSDDRSQHRNSVIAKERLAEKLSSISRGEI